MRIVILYQTNSERERSVIEYGREFAKRGHSGLELVSVDTPAGSDMAELYGIMTYPAVLAIQSDGQLAKFWADEHLPLMDEVAAYASQSR